MHVLAGVKRQERPSLAGNVFNILVQKGAKNTFWAAKWSA
jgi:hypothetical protein